MGQRRGDDRGRDLLGIDKKGGGRSILFLLEQDRGRCDHEAQQNRHDHPEAPAIERGDNLAWVDAQTLGFLVGAHERAPLIDSPI